MTRRIIDSSMWQNEKFTEMPICARLLQVNLINFSDDQGRAKATPKYLKIQVFPFDDISLEDIQTWLELIRDNGTVELYTVDGKQYVQFINWWKYQALQYAQASAYPRPEEWKDRIRRTHTKGTIVTCNWHTVDGSILPDTCDQDGNPLPKQAKPSPKTPEPTPEQASSHSPESLAAHSPESLAEDTMRMRMRMRTKDEDEDNSIGALPEIEKPSSNGHRRQELSSNQQQPARPKQQQANHTPVKEKAVESLDAAAKSDPEFERMQAKLIANKFGESSDDFSDRLHALWDTYDHDWFDPAIKICLDAHNNTIRYLVGILKRWVVEGPGGYKANGGKPPAAPLQLLTLKRWCLDRYNTDNPKFVQNVPEGMIREQYEQYRKQYYQQQQAH